MAKSARKKVEGDKAVAKPKPNKPKKRTAIKKVLPIIGTGDASALVLDRLYAVVESRRTASPDISHSARLLQRGPAKVAQKFGEEAVECLIEAVAGNRTAVVAESADVLYHLLVLWVSAGVEPDEVWAELTRREGISGIAEKAAREKVLAIPRRLRTKKIP
ncbi:phosphoribosyl-ATP diphosphatase [Rhodopila sp.]|jgi:phosphoribosyl-ATP pyrophosphohydrolase|uniref:phosphoribosyl-ATP diphosphatase n=1 Tax=Rhodopila sp. TaxID=2480087 RepID=UPI002C88A2E4|nr:phosphoribosyl-ATP diphosphatase [Rhodopila sp.]HVZ07677.1 phosphoribosyl-ATP diphosphatase [Rhodopila sp.]